MLAAVARLLAPPTCAGCNLPGPEWCPRCASTPASPRCTHIGFPVHSRYDFAGPVRRTIIDWKDEGRREATVRVTRWMREGLLPLLRARPDAVLVAVPASPRSERRRGASVLSEAVQRAVPEVSLEPWLQAMRVRRDQVGLDRASRDRNLRDSMQWIGPQNRHIIIVDDVMTTGATLRECARAMRSAGVAPGSAFTIAHREHAAPVADAAAGLRLS